MPGSPFDSVFILYNRGKLINSREEKKMLLKRENAISDSMSWFYRVNDHKMICFDIERDRSINSIGLINLDPEGKDHWYETKTLCYMDQIILDDGDLDVDRLMIMIAREEHGCVRA